MDKETKRKILKWIEENSFIHDGGFEYADSVGVYSAELVKAIESGEFDSKPKEHDCKDHRILIHCFGDDDLFRCSICKKEWTDVCKMNQVWNKTEENNIDSSDKFNGFM